jgi:hypothetical protein
MGLSETESHPRRVLQGYAAYAELLPVVDSLFGQWLKGSRAQGQMEVLRERLGSELSRFGSSTFKCFKKLFSRSGDNVAALASIVLSSFCFLIYAATYITYFNYFNIFLTLANVKFYLYSIYFVTMAFNSYPKLKISSLLQALTYPNTLLTYSTTLIEEAKVMDSDIFVTILALKNSATP